MKMNKKQYNHVIEHTLKHELCAQPEDSLEVATLIRLLYGKIDKDLSFLMSSAAQQGSTYLINYYAELINNEQYHWDTIRNSCPDTYDFLKSLQNR